MCCHCLCNMLLVQQDAGLLLPVLLVLVLRLLQRQQPVDCVTVMITLRRMATAHLLLSQLQLILWQLQRPFVPACAARSVWLAGMCVGHVCVLCSAESWGSSTHMRQLALRASPAAQTVVPAAGIAAGACAGQCAGAAMASACMSNSAAAAPAASQAAWLAACCWPVAVCATQVATRHATWPRLRCHTSAAAGVFGHWHLLLAFHLCALTAPLHCHVYGRAGGRPTSAVECLAASPMVAW